MDNNIYKYFHNKKQKTNEKSQRMNFYREMAKERDEQKKAIPSSKQEEIIDKAGESSVVDQNAGSAEPPPSKLAALQGSRDSYFQLKAVYELIDHPLRDYYKYSQQLEPLSMMRLYEGYQTLAKHIHTLQGPLNEEPSKLLDEFKTLTLGHLPEFVSQQEKHWQTGIVALTNYRTNGKLGDSGQDFLNGVEILSASVNTWAESLRDSVKKVNELPSSSNEQPIRTILQGKLKSLLEDLQSRMNDQLNKKLEEIQKIQQDIENRRNNEKYKKIITSLQDSSLWKGLDKSLQKALTDPLLEQKEKAPQLSADDLFKQYNTADTHYETLSKEFKPWKKYLRTRSKVRNTINRIKKTLREASRSTYDYSEEEINKLRDQADKLRNDKEASEESLREGCQKLIKTYMEDYQSYLESEFKEINKPFSDQSIHTHFRQEIASLQNDPITYKNSLEYEKKMKDDFEEVKTSFQKAKKVLDERLEHKELATIESLIKERRYLTKMLSEKYLEVACEISEANSKRISSYIDDKTISKDLKEELEKLDSYKYLKENLKQLDNHSQDAKAMRGDDQKGWAELAGMTNKLIWSNHHLSTGLEKFKVAKAELLKVAKAELLKNAQVNIWNGFLTEEDVVHLIKTSKVISSKPARQTGPYPEKVTLECGIVGLFKRKSQDRGLESHESEIAAYQIAKALELQMMVPLTVSCKMNGEEGSFQLWVNNLKRGERDRLSEDVRFFDLLICNFDRVIGNFGFLDNSDRVVLYDHANAFYLPKLHLAASKLPSGSVRIPTPSPSILEKAQQLNMSMLEQIEGLTRDQREAFLERRDRLITAITAKHTRT